MAANGNSERFRDDFMFQLTVDEYDSLRSQFATLKSGREQHRKYMPYAFTEPSALCGFELPDVRVVALLFQCPNVHSLLHPQPQTSTIAQ